MAKLKIDVNDLHKYYGKNEVLKGITTKFYEGDVVCIIGPSGSGKSTFLRSLNLLEEVTSGHITVNGYDLTEKSTNVDHVRENVGMVFQHFNLFPHMSVLENITFAPIEHKRMTKEEAEKLGMELLEKVGLADKANANPDSLSGGQKQRLALAVALLNEAPVIVLDEPTSGLDGRNMRSVSKQLHALAQKGHIILMITHDLECALATCSRALVIRDGTLTDDFQIDDARRLMAAMRE